MTFISIDGELLRRAASNLLDKAAMLDDFQAQIATAFMLKIQEALTALYGPHLGAIDGAYWRVTYVPGSGEGKTLGLLTVESHHPFVMGYEFGTVAHTEIAVNAPDLIFQRTDLPGHLFVGPGPIAHPGAIAHQNLPYLEIFIRQCCYFGWSNAIYLALNGLPYEGNISVSPPVRYDPQYDLTHLEDFGGNH